MRPAVKQQETTGEQGEAVKQPPVRRHGPLTIEDITTKPLTVEKTGGSLPLARRFLTFRIFRRRLTVRSSESSRYHNIAHCHRRCSRLSCPFWLCNSVSTCVVPSIFISATVLVFSVASFTFTCLWPDDDQHYICLTGSMHMDFFFGIYLIGVGQRVFFILHFLLVMFLFLCPPVFCISFCTPSVHLSFSLPIFQCPLPSIVHVRNTTSSSVFVSTCPNYLSLASLMFSPMFSTPALALISSFLIFSILFIPIIHLNILSSGPSSHIVEVLLMIV